jgi:hypothetical protein
VPNNILFRNKKLNVQTLTITARSREKSLKMGLGLERGKKRRKIYFMFR